MIPKNKEDQNRLQKDKTKNYSAGIIFLVVMVLTLLITFIESIYEVTHGEGGEDAQQVAEGMEGADNDMQRRLKRLLVGH